MSTRGAGQPAATRELGALHDGEILHRGRLAMGGMLGTELARILRVAPKTITRWYGAGGPGASGVSAMHLGLLAPHVFPHDADLAREMHVRAVRFHGEYGGLPPPSLPGGDPRGSAAPKAPALPPNARIDALVCVACEAMDVSPRALRPALLAAFRAARELQLSIDDVEKHLAPAQAPPKKKAGS